MAILNIRNLSDDVHTRLRIRAAKAGRSMEAEAREILTEAVNEEQDVLSADELQNWVNELYKGEKPKNVVETLIAERRLEAKMDIESE